MNRQDNVKMFEQTLEISAAGTYEVGGKTVSFQHGLSRICEAEYFSERDVARLRERTGAAGRPTYLGSRCDVHMTATDTLTAAIAENERCFPNPHNGLRPVLALNFANPVHPGGGVRRGAFGNDPEMVAGAFASALRGIAAPMGGFRRDDHAIDECLGSVFCEVCFAVPGGPGKSANYDAFEREFGDFYRGEGAAGGC